MADLNGDAKRETTLEGAGEQGNEPKRDSAAAAALTVGSDAGSASSRQPRRASRIVAWCVLALAAVAIVACGWAVIAPSLQQSDAQRTQNAVSASGEEADGSADVEGKSTNDGQGQNATSAGDDASSDDSAGSSQAASGADASAVTLGSSSSDGAESSSGRQSFSDASSSGSSASASDGAEAPSGSGSGSSNSGSATAERPPADNTVTVTVTIDSSAAGSPVSLSTTLTFEQGATVYDALVGTGVAVGASQTAYGVYVSSIGGLAEKQYGPNSGWTYYVNGAFVNTACSGCVLSDGDSVLWTYVNVTE